MNMSDHVNQEGMILSDEPGYYEDGNFGIRIETLVRVVPAETKFSEKSRTPFLTFTPVTVVPIQVIRIVHKVHLSLLKPESNHLVSRQSLSWRN